MQRQLGQCAKRALRLASLTITCLPLLLGCQSCHSTGSESAATSRPTRVSQARAAGTLTRTGTIDLPHGAPGIGFDDLRLAPALDKMLVPAGRSGLLDLVEPGSNGVIEVRGFSEQGAYSGGHDDGVTSADFGAGTIFAVDRTTRRLSVVDPTSRIIIRSVALAAHPDYVRFVETTDEVWVTEPDAAQLEIFALGGDGRHPTHAASIALRGGPESLVIDPNRSRAYTHLWHGASVAIDVRARMIVSSWNNGCRSSRGIALDAEQGFLIAACAEGRVTVLDVRSGRLVSKLEAGRGVDVIDFDPRTRHVYVPSAGTATMLVAALAPDGRLSGLGHVATVRGAHCAAADRRGNAYVCDPARGRLLVFRDELRAPEH